MALAINATLQDPYANSYIEQAYADSYFETHYDSVKASAWAALSDPQKTMLLIRATRVIETLKFTVLDQQWYNWELIYDWRSGTVLNRNTQLSPPSKSIYTQHLQFPRNLDVDETTGDLYIPEPIFTAQCEQAIYILNFDETVMSNKIQGVEMDKTQVGSINLQQKYGLVGSSVAPLALEDLRPYIIRRTVNMRRG